MLCGTRHPLKSTTPDPIKRAIRSLRGARFDFRPLSPVRGHPWPAVHSGSLAAGTAAELSPVIETRVDAKSEIRDLDTHIDAHRKCITLAFPLDPP